MKRIKNYFLVFYKSKSDWQVVFKNKKQKTYFDKLFLFLFQFCKNIVNSIYIILIKFNSGLIKNENIFAITKIKNK